ncbi:class I SAM-dependent methyltransferase [Nitratireductor pacificus]|uniref:Type 12 methyltransferase n=1 Tax=Nitratireductor pacificus pht-3B TaxID=391937 RepID=K2LLI7_9HYPH|nr:class I SAM-dependent methyltransferase [Nitratireductor pacificus]EKF18619.1 type 12 methyltransferase [Nitratireductor pacificus pht-3B]
MTAFPDQAALDYDKRILRLVPGYRVALDLMACQLASRTTGEPRILVPGCGTGAEIIALARHLPDARFTGFDPSEGMLGVARARTAAAGIGERTALTHGMLHDLPDEPHHDAATVSLVLHFLPDDGTKLTFLTGIARRLVPGAPLLLFDAIDRNGDDDTLRIWLQSQGHDAETVESVLRRMRGQWYRTTAERLDQLLADAGFGEARTWFRACGFHGVCAERRQA